MKVFPLAQNPGAVVRSDGMELRDWFAAMAVNGIMCDPECAQDPDETWANWCATVASQAYDVADAMIAARTLPAPPEDPLPPIEQPGETT